MRGGVLCGCVGVSRSTVERVYFGDRAAPLPFYRARAGGPRRVSIAEFEAWFSRRREQAPALPDPLALITYTQGA